MGGCLGGACRWLSFGVHACLCVFSLSARRFALVAAPVALAAPLRARCGAAAVARCGAAAPLLPLHPAAAARCVHPAALPVAAPLPLLRRCHCPLHAPRCSCPRRGRAIVAAAPRCGAARCSCPLRAPRCAATVAAAPRRVHPAALPVAAPLLPPLNTTLRRCHGCDVVFSCLVPQGRPSPPCLAMFCNTCFCKACYRYWL